MIPTQVALITGGTRRIGLAIAHELAQAGYALALVYLHNEAAAEKARAELMAITPHLFLLQADVGTVVGAEKIVQKTYQKWGRLDVVVNSVGPFIPSDLMGTSLEAYQQMVAGNLGSVFHVCQAAIPIMRQQGDGCLINLGSLNAEVARGAPNATLYHALKAAVVVLTKSIARSEGPYGIRANVVNPGMVDLLGTSEQIVARIPLGRLGTRQDVARAVAWLVSNDATYINGAVLNVHGGLWA